MVSAAMQYRCKAGSNPVLTTIVPTSRKFVGIKVTEETLEICPVPR